MRRRPYQTHLPVDLPEARRPGKRRDLEGPILRACVNWLRWQYPRSIVHHSPNERLASGRDAAREVAKHRHNGMLPGYPDIVWHHAGSTVLFEVKHPKGSLSETQEEMQRKASENGIPYHVVRSLDELQAAVKEALS